MPGMGLTRKGEREKGIGEILEKGKDFIPFLDFMGFDRLTV